MSQGSSNIILSSVEPAISPPPHCSSHAQCRPEKPMSEHASILGHAAAQDGHQTRHVSVAGSRVGHPLRALCHTRTHLQRSDSFKIRKDKSRQEKKRKEKQTDKQASKQTATNHKHKEHNYKTTEQKAMDSFPLVPPAQASSACFSQHVDVHVL